MMKRHELSETGSCFNKAHDDEILFVLLARDVAAPATIRAWCAERVRLGKNAWDDPQVKEALRCAESMEMQRDANPGKGLTEKRFDAGSNPSAGAAQPGGQQPFYSTGSAFDEATDGRPSPGHPEISGNDIADEIEAEHPDWRIGLSVKPKFRQHERYYELPARVIAVHRSGFGGVPCKDGVLVLEGRFGVHFLVPAEEWMTA